MKKFIAVMVLVFTAAAVSTVCFAVALGSTAVRDIASGDWSYRFDRIENFFENIDDKFNDNLDWDDDNFTLVQSIDMDAYENFEKDTIKIGCDAAELILLPSDDGKLSAKMDVYSVRQKDYSDTYTILTDKDDFDIYFNQTEPLASTSIKAVVYIPDTVKSIILDASVGDVEIKSFNLDVLDIKVNTGEVDIESTTAEKCNIEVNTGEINLENGFNILSELRASVNTGEISCDLPYNRGFLINYNISIGDVECKSELINSCSFYNEAGDKVSNPARAGKIEYMPQEDGAFTAYLKVNIGSIEFGRDY